MTRYKDTYDSTLLFLNQTNQQRPNSSTIKSTNSDSIPSNATIVKQKMQIDPSQKKDYQSIYNRDQSSLKIGVLNKKAVQFESLGTSQIVFGKDGSLYYRGDRNDPQSNYEIVGGPGTIKINKSAFLNTSPIKK